MNPATSIRKDFLSVLDFDAADLERCLQAASARFRELPTVGQVREIGLIWAVEVVTDRATKAPPTPKNGPGWKIAEALWQKGVW